MGLEQFVISDEEVILIDKCSKINLTLPENTNTVKLKYKANPC